MHCKLELQISYFWYLIFTPINFFVFIAYKGDTTWKTYVYMQLEHNIESSFNAENLNVRWFYGKQISKLDLKVGTNHGRWYDI